MVGEADHRSRTKPCSRGRAGALPVASGRGGEHRARVARRVRALCRGADGRRGGDPAAPRATESIQAAGRPVGRAFVLGVRSVDDVAAGAVGLLTVLDRQTGEAQARALVVAADAIDAVAGQALVAAGAGHAVRLLCGAGVARILAIGVFDAVAVGSTALLATGRGVAGSEPTGLLSGRGARTIAAGARRDELAGITMRRTAHRAAAVELALSRAVAATIRSATLRRIGRAIVARIEPFAHGSAVPVGLAGRLSRTRHASADARLVATDLLRRAESAHALNVLCANLAVASPGLAGAAQAGGASRADGIGGARHRASRGAAADVGAAVDGRAYGTASRSVADPRRHEGVRIDAHRVRALPPARSLPAASHAVTLAVAGAGIGRGLVFTVVVRVESGSDGRADTVWRTGVRERARFARASAGPIAAESVPARARRAIAVGGAVGDRDGSRTAVAAAAVRAQRAALPVARKGRHEAEDNGQESFVARAHAARLARRCWSGQCRRPRRRASTAPRAPSSRLPAEPAVTFRPGRSSSRQGGTPA